MNAEQTKAAAEVMLAHANGAKIQIRATGGRWHDFVGVVPVWNWQKFEYRVKKEPRTLYAVYTCDGKHIGTYDKREYAQSFAHRRSSQNDLEYTIVEFVEKISEN